VTPEVVDNVRYRRAHALVARWDSDGFVVDNYLTKDRIELTPALLQFIDMNPGPVCHDDLVAAFGSISGDGHLVEALIGHHIYLAEGTYEADRDERLNSTWAWDHVARWFHYGTRDTPLRTYPGPKTALPQVSNDLGNSTLDSCLAARRTIRRWAPRSLTASHFSSLLWWTWGTQRFVERSPIGPYQLKTSPSGGSRHSIEVYPVALKVDGIEPGVYHYAAHEHHLTLIRSVPLEELATRALSWFANQPWVADACAVFLMTAVLERSMWKYRHSHAYRVVLLDAGHLGQTFHLVCTALGLGPFTSSGLNETAIENALGVDGIREVCVYAAATGIAVPESAR
jgi:SagB-type dehydrogenase family enzyme